MRQVVIHGSQTSPANTNWTGFGGQIDVGSVEAQAKTPWLVAGTFSQFKITLGSAPGSGTSWTITVYKNGVATSVSVTISDSETEAEDTSNSFTVAANDLLALRWVATGSPAASGSAWYSAEFESDATGESGYAQQPGELIPDGGRRTGVFWPCYQSSNTWTNIAGSSMENVVPTAGTLTGYGVALSGAPGSGKSFVFHVYLNGVKQDGTGATVNTALTIADAAIYGSTSFSLTLAAGDRVYLEATPVNSPNQPRAGAGFRFVATTDGESIMGGWVSVIKANTGTHYGRINGFDDSWESEVNARSPGAIATLSLAKFYGRAYTAPGSGTSWTLTVRDTGADTDLGVTIADASQQESDLLSTVDVAPSGLMAVQVAPTSSPTDGYITWAMVQTVAADAIRATTIFGEAATVTSTHTFAVNNDAVSRTLHLPNTVFIAPNLTIPETSTAPTATANMARIYVEDNGSGKTRLMVQFGTGAAQQIAIEP